MKDWHTYTLEKYEAEKDKLCARAEWEYENAPVYYNSKLERYLNRDTGKMLSEKDGERAVKAQDLARGFKLDEAWIYA